MRYLLLCCVLALTAPLHARQEGEILGLASRPNLFLSEGLTDHAFHPRAKGALRAVMLFARFPDANEDRTPRQLHRHLIPGAVKYYREASYGHFELRVDVRYQWYPMRRPSTDPGYDCSRHDTHKAYVAEAIAAADKDVDFSKYAVVYVVASKNKGTPLSPTLHAAKGRGIQVDGHEIRHAVTFGNDSRNANWGWQTVVHETGHILGLPDLYSYDRAGGKYKSLHRFVGSWDPMGHQRHGADYLAWHKYKLAWLNDGHFVVVSRGSVIREISHIRTDKGVKALVVPVSASEAFVAEVRHLSASRASAGVLIYKVATHVGSGKGPIRVIPAVEDDDRKHPKLAREYIALYHALHRAGSRFEDKASKVRIDVLRETEGGFQVRVMR